MAARDPGFPWKAVSFDLDGTLYDYDEAHHEALAASARFAERYLHLSESRFMELYHQSRERIHARLAGTAASHSRTLYFIELIFIHSGRFRLVSINGLEEAYWSSFLDKMQLRDGALDLLRRLSGEGVKLAVTSDMVATTQFRKLVRLGVAEYFDVVVTSEEAGAEKPAPGIFQLLISRLDVLPGEVIHVGDDYRRDVEGARDAGLNAIWFAPNGEGTESISVDSFTGLARHFWPGNL